MVPASASSVVTASACRAWPGPATSRHAVGFHATVPGVRLVLSVVLLAACARSTPTGVAEDAGLDARAAPSRDAAPDASLEVLGPCEDPALWAHPIAGWSERELTPSPPCGPTNLAGTGFAVQAPEACFRVTQAGPATGYDVGTTWRATAVGEGNPTVAGLSMRVGAGPLEVTARFVVEGRLREAVATLATTTRQPLLEGIEDFVGFGRPGVRGVFTVVTASTVLSTEGERLPLSGRGLDAVYLGYDVFSTVVLVDTAEGRILEAFAREDATPSRRVPLDVSPSARFVVGAAALFDPDSREVVLFDLSTLRESARLPLPEGAADDFVVAYPFEELFTRRGETVSRSVPGAPVEVGAEVPGLRRLVPRASPGCSTTPLLVGEDAFGFLGERLDGAPPSLAFPLAAPFEEAPVVATQAFWVSARGFMWVESRTQPPVGPRVDDVRVVHGGPLVDVVGDGLHGDAYAVRRPDGRVDVFPWSAGRCERE